MSQWAAPSARLQWHKKVEYEMDNVSGALSISFSTTEDEKVSIFLGLYEKYSLLCGANAKREKAFSKKTDET